MFYVGDCPCECICVCVCMKWYTPRKFITLCCMPKLNGRRDKKKGDGAPTHFTHPKIRVGQISPANFANVIRSPSVYLRCNANGTLTAQHFTIHPTPPPFPLLFTSRNPFHTFRHFNITSNLYSHIFSYTSNPFTTSPFYPNPTIPKFIFL